MKLADNIKRLRKERGITQEKLAEALGVTVGAAYKWENGKSIPELGVLLSMAQLFDISLDVLVGYEVMNSGAKTGEERIHRLQSDKNYTEAMREAEIAVLRYPNDFGIIYRAGELYSMAGMEEKNERYINRGIELAERSILLLSQNTDPDISESFIRNLIARCYISLGKKEKGLEILKKYNVCGVNDPIIAMTHALDDFSYKEAEPYSDRALTGIVNASAHTMIAYGNYYNKNGNYLLAKEAFLWLAHTLEGLKTQKDSVCCLDRIIAPCYGTCAVLAQKTGNGEEVYHYLRIAYDMARAFDDAPVYKLENIKFLFKISETVAAYDDLDKSAVATVEAEVEQNDVCSRIWQDIKGERK